MNEMSSHRTLRATKTGGSLRLDYAGLADRAGHRPSQLSGGPMQRDIHAGASPDGHRLVRRAGHGLIVLLLAVIAATLAIAGTTASPAGGVEARAHPPLVRIEEQGTPNLYSMRLVNGLRVVIDARPERRTVYCEIGVRVGSRNEPLRLAGMSHLLEHLLFKEGEAPGSRKNPAFSRIRAAGGEVNAMTSFERTNYYCDVHGDAFEEGFRGLANLVTAVGFDAHDVEVERRVVLEEAALDKNNPLSVAAYSVLRRLFPGDPLCQPVIGYRKTLQRIRLEDVRSYYERFYVPENSYALIVGNVDPDVAAALVTTTLEGWRRSGSGVASGRAEPLEFPPAPTAAPPQRFVFHTFTHQVYYAIGVLTTGENDRYRAATELLSTVLGGGRSSRLEQRIVEREGLTSELQSADFRISNLGLFATGGAVEPSKSDRFRSILRDELDRLTREPVRPDELARAKTLLRADLVRQFESNAGIAEFRGDRLLYGQDVSRDPYLDEALRLTPQDLYVAAQVQLGADRIREVEIRPARGFGKILAAIRYLLFRRI